MTLSNELISQLVKVTNDRQTERNNVVVYGTIREDGSRKYVQIDGSDEFTPVETTVEIEAGDRVTVDVRNHAATITGNTTNPAVGVKTADGLRSEIEQTAEQIRLELSNEMSGVEASLKMTADDITTLVKSQDEFSKFKQTVEGFSFMGSGGSVKISGGDINLTGSITFGDLSEELAADIEDAKDTADSAMSTANSAASGASSAYSIARSIANGSYIGGTFINGKEIQSPTIKGNEIMVYGTFQTIGSVDGSQMTTGYMGAATGMDAGDNTTYGVALSNAWNASSQQVGNSYVIVTDSGVRLQYNDNSVIVSKNGIYLRTPGNTDSGVKCKAYYNDGSGNVEIGAGSSAVAVWG